MLSTRTARAIDVDTQIRRVDLDIDVIVHFGRDEHGCERGVAAIAGIERRLAHETVDAGLRPQPAVGVLTNDVHCSALHTGDFARRRLDHIGFEVVRLRPAEIHAQEHFRPVLRFRAAGARLYVQVGVVRVHLAGEHATKLEAGQLRLEAIQVAHEFGHRRLVVLFERKFEKLTRVAQARRKLIQHLYDLFELRSLLSQGLGTLRFVPDVRLFQFASDLGQALCFAFVVKDTPSTHRCVP